MSVCYDLRFPELYRRLASAGAEVIVVPAAFTADDRPGPLGAAAARAGDREPGVRDRRRASTGAHDDGTRLHGRSMIVDPWGVVLAQAPDGEGVVVADLDFARLAAVRERLPALRHRRADVYGSLTPRLRGRPGRPGRSGSA